MVRRALLLTALALTLRPERLAAQEALDAWSRLDATSRPTVSVLADAGKEVTGTLLRVEPDAIVLGVRGREERFERTHITRVDRRGDSVRNGALIGAGIGVALGLAAALIADCPAPEPGGSCPGTRAAGLAISIAAYTGIGIGIDALVAGRTTLYPGAAPGAPEARHTGQAPRMLRVSLRW